MWGINEITQIKCLLDSKDLVNITCLGRWISESRFLKPMYTESSRIKRKMHEEFPQQECRYSQLRDFHTTKSALPEMHKEK